MLFLHVPLKFKIIWTKIDQNDIIFSETYKLKNIGIK